MWWADTWQMSPVQVDEVPYRRAQLMREVKDALEKGRGLAEQDARRRAEQDAKRHR